jgi:hypothetical protein
MREHNTKAASENKTARFAARAVINPTAAMKKLFFTVLPIICLQAFAADPALPSAPVPNNDLFRAHELTLDLYSSYSTVEPNGIAGIFDTNARHGKFGTGLASTYWVTRNFGVGLDSTIPAVDNISGALFDQISLSFEARVPVGHLCPYAFGGLGRNFESGLWNSHAGAGVEWRFSQSTGIFVDARYIFASHETDSMTLRSGVRFSF